MLAMLTSAGCMDMGGSGRLVWYEAGEPATPIIPELPGDEPSSPIPLPPSSQPAATGGDDEVQPPVPDVPDESLSEDYPVKYMDTDFRTYGTVYSGPDTLPDELPRDPIEFTHDDVIPILMPHDLHAGFAPSVSIRLNASDGRFLFNSAVGEAWPYQHQLQLWTDLSSPPVAIDLPDYAQIVEVTDMRDADAMSLDANDVQDLAIQFRYLEDDEYRTRIVVLYDWPDRIEGLDETGFDWTYDLMGDTNWNDYARFDMGDFNGDNTADLCLIDNGLKKIQCFFGGPDGLPVTPDIEFGLSDPGLVTAFWQLRMDDVNCDGLSDIVVGWATTTGTIAVLPGSDSMLGEYLVGDDVEFALMIQSGTYPLAHHFGMYFSLGDVNGDGCSDLFANKFYFGYNNITYAFRGDASTSYSSPRIETANLFADITFEADEDGELSPDMVTYLDLNGDGYRDLVYSHWVLDYENGIARLYHVFEPGSENFFGSAPTIRHVEDASSLFLIEERPMLAES
jgi:hypothetical protein